MKFTKKLLSVLCATAITASLATTFGTTASAAAATKIFLDPYDETSYTMVDGKNVFNKAYSYDIKVPNNYDRDRFNVLVGADGKDNKSIEQEGGVFGFNGDKTALAAFQTNNTMKIFNEVYGAGNYKRKQNLMKNFVACESDLIYYFENGFKEFEFMGIGAVQGGANFWAGAWGMEENPPLEISYSNSATGGWTVMKYSDMRVMPSGEASAYCYFCNTDKNTSKKKPSIPTSARYLRIRFLNGATWDDTLDNAFTGTKGNWKTNYSNWQCVLGYLLVNEYTEPQGGSTGGSTGTSSNTTGSIGGSTGTSSTTGATSSGAAASDASEAVSDDETDATSDDTSSAVDKDDAADATKGDYYVEVTREIDWKITGIIIAADVLAVGGAIAVLILLYRKKLKQLGIVVDHKNKS